MTLVVGLGVLEDETVGTLQPVGAFFHTVRSIFEVTTFHTLVGALREAGRRTESEWRGRGAGQGKAISKMEGDSRE